MPIRGDDFEETSGNTVLEEFFQRYYRPIQTFFIRRGFSVQESEDLAQETFLLVYRNWESYRGESSLETWLFQIAANRYKNALRTQGTYKREASEVSLSAPDDVDGAHSVEDLSDPLGEILSGERARLLREALEELPPQMKRCALLRVASDLKYREIAVLMNCSIETVKAHLYQARQHLRDRLADYFTDEEF